MHYVSAEGLSKSYGIQPLFQNIQFNLEEGDKIALVARNGVGKSTLLRILMGQESPDHGKLWIHKDVQVALLEQDPVFEEEKTILENIFHDAHPVIQTIKSYEAALDAGDETGIADALVKMDADSAWDFEAKVRQILARLNIHHLTSPVKDLSGG
ncbi:MAG: ABC transporter ATP-binding protein, partial [Sphingobacteriia bacterium]